MTDHLIFYSGGLASWATAMRVAEKHGTKNLKMLFTDTKMEDEDLYRFLDESAVVVGGGELTFFDIKKAMNERKAFVVLMARLNNSE